MQGAVSGFVFGEQSPNPGLRVGAGTFEVFGGVVEFVVVEIELSFGDGELVGDVLFLRFGRGGQAMGESLDILLLGLECGFRRGLAVKESFLVSREFRSALRSGAEGIFEGEVYFVVAYFLGFPGNLLLFGSRGQSGEPLSGVERALVHQGRIWLGCFVPA